jgi:hypothetical protein
MLVPGMFYSLVHRAFKLLVCLERVGWVDYSEVWVFADAVWYEYAFERTWSAFVDAEYD